MALHRIEETDNESASSTKADEKAKLFLHYLGGALDAYGSQVKNVVFWKFEEMHQARRLEIYLHPEKFVETLRYIFGTGAGMVEKAIIREMKRCIDSREIDSSNLVTALRQVRREISGIA